VSALGVAAAVAAGERTARSVAEDHLNRIDEGDGEIGAFNLVLAEEALADADRVDAALARGEDVGPLAGVPVALKDNLCTRGIPTTCSSRMLEGWRPPYSATVVERLRAAGAVVVGKTNLDEFAMGSSTENSAFGPTRNPRDTSRVPGGSSGGSAAAVAAGFAALALGSDTGGSIRQPAALCGVVGMKPTYGRVSRYGLIAFASSLDQIGPFGATVADAAACYEAIAGHDPLDSTSLDRPLDLVDGALEDGVEGLRIGVLAELCGGRRQEDHLTGTDQPVAGGVEGVAGDVLSRVEDAAEALEQAGAEVRTVSVPSAVLGLSAYYLIAPAEASSNLARYDGVRYGLRVDGANAAEMNVNTRTAGFGAEVKRRIMLGTYALSAGYYDAFYGKALRVRTLMLEEFAAVYEDVDVLLCPTAPTTAFDLGAKTADPLLMYLNDVCTIPSNLTGHPAISVPYGRGDDGLPVGVQVMGPALSERLIFRVAAALERTVPNDGSPP
jgi:aspartyl-tRNA(Asn)/glutamyl-tRNA(Gln) amidotransferase subunit A